MRKSIAILVALTLTAALAIPAMAATRTVKVGDFFFVRNGSTPTVSVRRGTTVKWLWVGQIRHNVTVLSGPVKFHSRTITKGSFSRQLTRAGTYRIICTIHPNMKMTLRVTR
jgi:plastocyanin